LPPCPPLILLVPILWITLSAGYAQDLQIGESLFSEPAHPPGRRLTTSRGLMPVLTPTISEDQPEPRQLDAPPWASQSLIHWQPAHGSLRLSAGAGKRRSGVQPVPTVREPGTLLTLSNGSEVPFDMKNMLESLSYYLGLGLNRSWFHSQWTLKADIGAIVQGDNTSPGSVGGTTDPNAPPFAFTLFDRSPLPFAIYPVIFIGITRPF
jgi:hypothetical protein